MLTEAYQLHVHTTCHSISEKLIPSSHILENQCTNENCLHCLQNS